MAPGITGLISRIAFVVDFRLVCDSISRYF